MGKVTAKNQVPAGVGPQPRDKPNDAAVSVKSSGAFVDACKEANVQPTTRQAKKWLRKMGAAWAVHLRMRNKT